MSILSALGDAVNPVKFAIDGFTTIWHTIKGTLPPDKQHEAEMELMKLQIETSRIEREYEAKLEELMVRDQESLRKQAIAEMQSGSKYVSWARPSWLWGLLMIYLGDYFVLPAASWFSTRPFVIPEIPYEVHLLVGILVGGMAYLRTIEKTGRKVPFSKE